MISFAIALAVVLASGPATVDNPQTGLWDDPHGKRLHMSRDLVIGKEEGGEGEVLGRVLDIALDSTGSIYVLDGGFARVRVYDRDGCYLRSVGRRGEGPGEFSFPTAIAVDGADRLYVADVGSRINVFDSTGRYVDQFRHEFPGNIIRSLKIDPAGDVYVSCLDVFEQQILHKYNLAHEYLFSFCDSYAVGREVDVRIEQVFAGGAIDVDPEGDVYFTQMTPYEIRKFSPEGRLLSVIHRENRFMKPPEPEITQDGMIVTMPTASSSIVLLDDGRFINVVKKPPVPQPPAETILDLFDADGRLLTSQTLERDLNLKCRDSKGRVYAIEEDDCPLVVRYRLSFE